MKSQITRGTRLSRVLATYLDAHRSEQQLQQQANDLRRRIVVLQRDRGLDPAVLAAAQAEQTARTQLAAQAMRTSATARLCFTDFELHRAEHRVEKVS